MSKNGDIEMLEADQNTVDETAPVLSKIGERWTLLIIWASLNGISRFDDYQRHLGVARNILSVRLRRLVELGILKKIPVRDGARRLEYLLTEKGESLREPIQAMEAWGRDWNIR